MSEKNPVVVNRRKVNLGEMTKKYPHWARKLSRDQVRTIFSGYWFGENQGVLARDYGVSQATVNRICQRKLYLEETADLAGMMNPNRKQKRSNKGVRR